MPPLALIAPRLLKRILELEGYELEGEYPSCWALMKDRHVAVIPKYGDLVSFDIMEPVLHGAGIDHHKYFELKKRAETEVAGTAR